MGEGEDQDPGDDGPALADPSVGDQAAQDRQGVDQAGGDAKGLGGQAEGGHGPVDPLEQAAVGGEPQHVLHMPRLQQLLGHVEGQHDLHAEVAERPTHVGAEDEDQTLGMAEEGAVVPRGGPLGFSLE